MTWLAWEPTGQALVFLADTKGDELTQLYRIGLDDDPAQVPTNDDTVQYKEAFGHPYSPDGLWLVYGGNDRSPSDQDVLIRNVKTGEVRRLYADGGRVWAGHWSPDGRFLTALELRGGNSDHVVYLIRLADGVIIRPPSREREATYWLGPWLPGSSSFLVQSDRGRDFAGIGVMDAATGP